MKKRYIIAMLCFTPAAFAQECDGECQDINREFEQSENRRLDDLDHAYATYATPDETQYWKNKSEKEGD